MSSRLRALAGTALRGLPDPAQAWVRTNTRSLRWRTWRRLQPLDVDYGYGRGTPIGRHFVREFVERNAPDVRGRTLEVGDATYSAQYADRVQQLDILDIDPENADATIVADLSDEGSLPRSTFDCIILTQTLQYVRDAETALANVWEALRPGGVALVSAPATARRDVRLASVDRWRFLPAGLDTMLDRACSGAEAEVVTFGNVLVAMAALDGIAAEELHHDELTTHDPAFPVTTCARVRKPYEFFAARTRVT